MENTEFRKQAEEWLEPYGYSVHSHNPSWTNISFVCFDKLGENYPAITCTYSENGSTVRVHDNGLKLFITMEADNIAFLHKDIDRWIKAIKHYTDLCLAYPPNLN